MMLNQKILMAWLTIFLDASKKQARYASKDARNRLLHKAGAITRSCLGDVLLLFSVMQCGVSYAQTECSADTWSPPSFILRSDFNSINPLECLDTGYYPLEQGAQLSASRGFNALTSGVSIDGLAATVTAYKGRGGSGLQGLLIGPYIQGDGTYQFGTDTSPSKGIDTITYGVFTQFYVKYDEVYNGLRFRIGDVNTSAEINSTSFVGEWLPAFYLQSGAVGLPQEAPFVPLIYEFDIDLMAQYDHLNYGKNSYLLFHNNDDAVRVGPQLTLKTQVSSDALPPTLKNTFVDKLVLSVSAHTSEDLVSWRGFYLASATLTYNATDNLGVFCSYSYGNAEATGNFGNLLRAGLSLKF